MSTALSTLCQNTVLLILAIVILVVYCRTSANRRNEADKSNTDLSTIKRGISSIKHHLGVVDDANGEDRPKTDNN